MNEQKRLERSTRLHNNRYYALLQRLTEYLDRYYLDAALGFAIPGGIGDMISALFSLAYAYFAAFVIRSNTFSPVFSARTVISMQNSSLNHF